MTNFSPKNDRGPWNFCQGFSSLQIKITDRLIFSYLLFFFDDYILALGCTNHLIFMIPFIQCFIFQLIINCIQNFLTRFWRSYQNFKLYNKQTIQKVLNKAMSFLSKISIHTFNFWRLRTKDQKAKLNDRYNSELDE